MKKASGTLGQAERRCRRRLNDPAKPDSDYCLIGWVPEMKASLTTDV